MAVYGILLIGQYLKVYLGFFKNLVLNQADFKIKYISFI